MNAYTVQCFRYKTWNARKVGYFPIPKLHSSLFIAFSWSVRYVKSSNPETIEHSHRFSFSYPKQFRYDTETKQIHSDDFVQLTHYIDCKETFSNRLRYAREKQLQTNCASNPYA